MMVNKDISELFNSYSIIKKIDNENNNIISKNVRIINMNAGDFLSSDSVSCSGILFVLDGIVNVKKVNKQGEETNLYNISKGELCHEALSCIMDFKPLNIYAKALVNSKVCIIPTTIVNNYLIIDNEFMKYIYRDIFAKLGILINKKDNKNNESLEKRLITFIINSKSSIIYGTHKEIADEIDSSREAVSRKLKEFEKDNYIELFRGKIKIINYEGLKNKIIL